MDWLTSVLPWVDYFLPSFDELAFMLGKDDPVTLARRCRQMGARIVVIKLGTSGLLMIDENDVETRCPIFEAHVVGTTGSGDATIAGFLASVLDNPRTPTLDNLRFACAVGACSVEAVDATSGIPSKAAVEARMAAGWKQI